MLKQRMRCVGFEKQFELFDAFPQDGKRALQLACYLGHKNIVSMLLEHCVDIEAVDNVRKDFCFIVGLILLTVFMIQLGHNALHAACSSNNVDIVVLLVQKGISTTLEDKVIEQRFSCSSDNVHC